MYKRIMVAIDGSDVSNLAFTSAVNLAKNQAAKLGIIHVIDELIFNRGPLYPSKDELEIKLVNAAQELINAANAQANKHGLDSEIILLKSLENIGKVLSEEANKWSADLMVIGTNGLRGFARYLLGSTSEKFIRVATIPVLLICPQ